MDELHALIMRLSTGPDPVEAEAQLRTLATTHSDASVRQLATGIVSGIDAAANRARAEEAAKRDTQVQRACDILRNRGWYVSASEMPRWKDCIEVLESLLSTNANAVASDSVDDQAVSLCAPGFSQVGNQHDRQRRDQARSGARPLLVEEPETVKMDGRGSTGAGHSDRSLWVERPTADGGRSPYDCVQEAIGPKDSYTRALARIVFTGLDDYAQQWLLEMHTFSLTPVRRSCKCV